MLIKNNLIYTFIYPLLRILVLPILFIISPLTHAEEADKQLFTNDYEASMWLMKMSIRMEKFVKNDVARLDILRSVYLEAQKNKLDPNFVLSVMHVESRFNPHAVSSVGAQGLMQVMPFWKLQLSSNGRQDNLHDIRTNIHYGCKILKIYMEKENGNPMRALARYNGSSGQTWYPAQVLRAWKSNWVL